MTREHIEKAAGEYSGSVLGFKDNPVVMNKHKAFMDGAQWSAYGEELTRNVEVVAKTKRGYRFGKFDVVGYSNEYIGFVSTSSLEYALSDLLEYAYLSDLLPERKEETK